MAGLAWGSGGGNNLTPTGVGNGPSSAQMDMFKQAATDSGLADMGMQMADQMTGGMKNEDQLSAFYKLLASHPNEVSLFFLHYPQFIPELAGLIALIVRKELYSFFNSGIVVSSAERGGPMGVDAATATEYSSITQENIDAQITKVVPLQDMQMEVNNKDMVAMQMLGQGQMQQQQMQQQQYQQQMYQQQMYQQQMMQQQQPKGISGALGSFGSNLIRGTLNLPPTQQPQPMMRPGVPQTGMQGY